ncbi:NADP-dependent oxidoreductase [Nocardioides sp. 616]|uniref:MDR family NADP-dependent oxidoreductase n=1 Tax=Nocardioides sp. 616 TaxID=2268090 RepID=UPI000CE4EA0A|nr:NADP-dependent oxidoreductase [Nocardioides sp. 616]
MPPAVSTTHAVVVVSSPRGAPVAEDFAVTDVSLPARRADELLLRVDVLSLDPYLRSLLGTGHLEDPPVAPGQVMPGRSVATVLESDDASLPIGTRVLAETGWREHAVVPVAGATRVQVPPGAPVSALLGALGMPGLTAYAAHVRHLAPEPGDTVAISSATGGVGSLAGQLARHAGARTLGIVGSREKVALARSLGYEEVVVRTDPDWIDQLHTLCPEKIDAYLHMGDQATLDGVVEHLAVGARVSLCGLIDQSNGAPATRVRAGALMAARATTYGMVVYDHADLAAEHVEQVGALLAAGSVRLVEDSWAGLEQAGAAFEALMSGRNRGKVVVQVHREGE